MRTQNVKGAFFKVFQWNRPTFTIWSENLENARLYLEGRLKGVCSKPIRYTKLERLS